MAISVVDALIICACARRTLGEAILLRSSRTWSIGLAIDPPKSSALPDQEFIATIGSGNPKYTGWPIWLDAREWK
jgi:hypothetical protein